MAVLQHWLCPDISATQGLQRALQLLQVAVSTGSFNFCSLLLQNLCNTESRFEVRYKCN